MHNGFLWQTFGLHFLPLHSHGFKHWPGSDQVLPCTAWSPDVSNSWRFRYDFCLSDSILFSTDHVVRNHCSCLWCDCRRGPHGRPGSVYRIVECLVCIAKWSTVLRSNRGFQHQRCPQSWSRNWWNLDTTAWMDIDILVLGHPFGNLFKRNFSLFPRNGADRNWQRKQHQDRSYSLQASWVLFQK